MKRVLVTGAAGFIGAHLLQALSSNEEVEVVGLDSFSDYYSVDYKLRRVDALIGANSNQLIEVDVADDEQVDEMFRAFRPDVVVHLAAQAGVRLMTDFYSNYVHSNLTGFSNILVACARYETQSLLYASSSSVYGNQIQGVLSESIKSLLPTSFYGATKLSNELLAASISARHGIRTRGLRYFTVYGPWGRPDMAYFRMLESLVNHRPFSLNGDGSIQRDFTFVSDVVGMTIALMNDLNSMQADFCDVVNLGGGAPHSMTSLIGMIEHLSKKKLILELVDPEPSDVSRTESDKAYLESLIGRRHFVTLEEGLTRFLEWGEESSTSVRLADWVESSFKYTK